MRAIAATVFVFCFFMSPAWADEQADIKTVEDILKIEKEALEIRSRAGKRAKAAVEKSSLGKRRKAAKEAFDKANNALEQSKAYRQYLGSEKLNEKDRPLDWNKLRKWHDERARRSDAYTKAREPVDRLRDIYWAINDEFSRMEKKVFLIFLDDEIDKAVEAKLEHLSRELKKLRKEYVSA